MECPVCRKGELVVIDVIDGDLGSIAILKCTYCGEEFVGG